MTTTMRSGLLGLCAWSLTMTPCRGADVKTLVRGTYSAVARQSQHVARTEEEFRKIWDAHTARVNPRPPLPRVDFTKEMVVAVFLGQKSTGGYSVEVTQASPKDGAMVVTWKKTEPGGGIVTQSFTQPFHFGLIGRTELPVRFVESR